MLQFCPVTVLWSTDKFTFSVARATHWHSLQLLFQGKGFLQVFHFFFLIMQKMKSKPSDNLKEMKAENRLKSTKEISHMLAKVKNKTLGK